MSRIGGVDRRELIFGAVRTGASAALLSSGVGATARASVPGTPRREPLSAQSSDGTVLRGEAQGSAGSPEILYVHGLRQSRLSWEKQFVAPTLGGFRHVAFDLRGHGDSDKPVGLAAYSQADLWADDIAATIESAKLRRPVLVGWSLGGFAIGAYLRRHGASRVAGINLVDAVTQFSADLLTPLAGDFTRRCTSHDLAERGAATAEFLAACFHRQPKAEEFGRMLVVNGMTARDVNEGVIRTSLMDLEPIFGAYGGPVLSTHGAKDRLVRITMSERIAALKPENRLSLFRNSGHTPFFEEPERFNRELAAFAKAAADK